MVLMYWVLFAAAVAALVAGWVFVVPLCRSWKPLDRRMAEQSARSAELVRECSSTMGCGTAFGRLSTIR
ncbi:hypothetical protein QTH87_14440 [Variovorax sp. J22P168]|uniref:hypothetical protein n=1 Tax=Variovorax jilinensis TaxID=3053513 RepID=UPI0025768806|nr:hypothetical protein [Variovorax sp. J22P168]MDM0013636.1 hypothetical protein [Variovorax sp. J22P168]